jgi:hypothetical protein
MTSISTGPGDGTAALRGVRGSEICRKCARKIETCMNQRAEFRQPEIVDADVVDAY